MQQTVFTKPQKESRNPIVSIKPFACSSRARYNNGPMSKYKIGIIGGSGLYHLEGFTNQKWVKVKTPFGAPSDDFLTGKLAGSDVVFLPRHGRVLCVMPLELC